MGYEAYSLDGGFVAYLRWKFNKYLEQDKESGNNTSEENVKEIERSIASQYGESSHRLLMNMILFRTAIR